jgi:hypothetical protein
LPPRLVYRHGVTEQERKARPVLISDVFQVSETLLGVVDGELVLPFEVNQE